MAIGFSTLVAQLSGVQETRFHAATLLLRNYNLNRHPSVKAQVEDILELKEKLELIVGRWNPQVLYPHPQAVRWQD